MALSPARARAVAVVVAVAAAAATPAAAAAALAAAVAAAAAAALAAAVAAAAAAVVVRCCRLRRRRRCRRRRCFPPDHVGPSRALAGLFPGTMPGVALAFLLARRPLTAAPSRPDLIDEHVRVELAFRSWGVHPN